MTTTDMAAADQVSERVRAIAPALLVPSGAASATKRLIDVVGALLSFVVFLPFGLLIAVLIKATSRGPVFFVQERVGRDGRPFRVVKFRTMRDGTHREVMDCDVQRELYTSNDFKLPPDDHRITKVGRWLRKTSIDEAPQLWNVLRGEMSLVGIRPLLALELELRDPFDQAVYTLMRPGMTGLWQVEGRSSLHPEDRKTLDRRYVETWSLWNDVKLLAETPFAVLRIHHAH